MLYPLIELLYKYNIESFDSTKKIDKKFIKEMEKIARRTSEETEIQSVKFHSELSPKMCSYCGRSNQFDAEYCDKCKKKL